MASQILLGDQSAQQQSLPHHTSSAITTTRLCQGQKQGQPHVRQVPGPWQAGALEAQALEVISRGCVSPGGLRGLQVPTVPDSRDAHGIAVE